jgi:hypothetical protein
MWESINGVDVESTNEIDGGIHERGWCGKYMNGVDPGIRENEDIDELGWWANPWMELMGGNPWMMLMWESISGVDVGIHKVGP